MRAFCLLCAMISAFFLVPGCGNKEQPFTEWWASAKYRDFVPPDAQIVAEGTGKLKFTPMTPGTVYLLDLDDMRQVKEMKTPHVVTTAAPLPGPEITFDPATATVTREGRKDSLKLTNIVNGHRYQLRWVPEKAD